MTTSSPSPSPSRTHILIVPFPGQGHMISLLDLTHHLATLSPTLTLTVLTTPKNLHLLTPLLSSSPNITPLVLSFPTVGADAAATVEHIQGLPPPAVRKFIVTLTHLHHPLSLWFKSHPSPPSVIISDFFAGWTHRFATEHGIKRIVFSPSGAFALSQVYSLWRNMPKGKHPDDIVSFPDLPNCPDYPFGHVSYMYRSYVEGDPDSEVVRDCFNDDMASWGVVVNTFDGLERVYLDHLMNVLGHNRVWAVGPLLPSSGPGLAARGGPSSVDLDFITSWLDICPDNEVVYVSFGTQASLTARQVAAVAEALESSGVRFVWSVRTPLQLDGFENRVVDRGLVITGWAPQVAILRHRAVGVFFTHCGWNSILEGIMAGVGMLAWPMAADQFADAMLVVDELKVGVRVCEGMQTVPDPHSLAKTIAESVNGDILDRRMIGKLHDDCLKAVSKTGSSAKDLLSLLNKLTSN